VLRCLVTGCTSTVFPSEPPVAGTFEAVDNLVVTPHAAFYSDEAITESQTKAATNIVAVLQGREPKYQVN
jgi:D-3-phosphoglycerate dehydrogenase / 2-oxoglutarate reductase